MPAIYSSLAQANGRGSAGQCPAPTFAKTPAAQESGAALRRSHGHACEVTFPDGTAQPSIEVRLLKAELAQLREAATNYYVRSHAALQTQEGMDAGERLVRALAHARLVA